MFRKKHTTTPCASGHIEDCYESVSPKKKRSYTFDVESVRQILKCTNSYQTNLKEKCQKLLESNSLAALMSIATVYALYSSDVLVLFFDKSADLSFTVVSSIAFFLFLIEIILQCWCREKYLVIPSMQRLKSAWDDVLLKQGKGEKLHIILKALQIGSFYFWLDSMSTVSMIFEIPWLLPSFLSNEVNTNSNIDSARAGKASRAGAKAARMIKVVRMIRLIRLVKLYKYFSDKRHDDESTDKGITQESRLGAEMSDRTTKRVIVGILFLLIIIPLLQVSDFEYLNQLSLQIVFDRRFNYSSSKSQQQLESWLFTEEYFLNSTDCIHLEYNGFPDEQRLIGLIPQGRNDKDSLRATDKSIVSIIGGNGSIALTAEFDLSSQRDEAALLNIILTSFVIFLLAAGTMTFSHDVNNLVIIPIEKMVQLVNEISANPLGSDHTCISDELKDNDDGMETTLLLQTISKIAGLMRVGFGEAGAEIISKNLDLSGETGSMNLLGKGQKIYSIFAFCDVRSFTDTTECLQEEVMLFVNRIAYILHGIVVQYDGSANKNIGDAFLLTWKVKPNNSDLDFCKELDFCGDKALMSILKTLVYLRRYEDFICNFSSRALGALYERIPRYKCNIGCGLHFGWAIEGAIGSKKKIDATYISPHVNFSEFLESSTKDYGVPILISEPFHRLLSPNAQLYCRQVDNIKRRDSEDKIVGLFTYDADLNSVGVWRRKNEYGFIDEGNDMQNQGDSHSFASRSRSIGSNGESFITTKRRLTQTVLKRKRVNPINKLLGETPDITMPKFTTNLWDLDDDLHLIRSHMSNFDIEYWRKGINAYFTGDWKVARSVLSEINESSSLEMGDGPSCFLLSKMSISNFQAPNEWDGFRVI